jgi:hypothetical protein
VGGSTTNTDQTTTTVVVKAGASGSYTLSLTTDGSGFETQTCHIDVTVNANPVVSILADTTACAAPSLAASGAVVGDTINWTGPSGGIPTGTEHNATIFPTKAGTYTVQIIRNTCPSNTASGDLCFAFSGGS